MKRMASLAVLTAAFPSVDPQNLRLMRKAWRLPAHSPEFLTLVSEQAPRTWQWMRDCYHQPSRIEVRRRVCDELLDTFGVEHLGIHRRSQAHVYYCNAGDTYAPTLIFHGGHAYVGCWGDLVERKQIKESCDA